jgi:dinuclear metal center YbgI/SA1388 family protein
MGVNLRQFVDCIEKFCPSRLALPGDFVGIQVGSRDRSIQERFKIRKCAISLDVTPQVILKAAANGANVLLVYHGLLPRTIETFTGALLDRIRLLIENRMDLYVVHTSWLSAECGVNDTLADILDLKVAEAFDVELEGKRIPLGRVCNFGESKRNEVEHRVKNFTLSDFIQQITYRLDLPDAIYVGNLHAPAKRVLIMIGEYGKQEWLRIAAAKGVDTYVTGTISRETAVLSNELKLNYVYVDNHTVESLGMRRLMQLLSIDIPEVDFVFIESQHSWKRYTSPDATSKIEDGTKGEA